MVRDILRFDLAVNSVSKPLDREQCQPEGFTVYVNSDKIVDVFCEY